MIHSPQEAGKLFLTLLCLELLLVVIYLTDVWIQGPAGQLHSLIDLDAEGNLPAWFSSFQLALIAISFWVLAARFRATQRPSRSFLRACSGFFLLLSLDETAMLHERITESLGSRYLEWVPVYLADHPVKAIACGAILVACITAVYPQLRGLWQISARSVRIAAAGCIVYVTGAAVFESIGYAMLKAGASLSLYRAEVAVEELLEMLGASLILYAVLRLCVSTKDNRAARTTASPRPVFGAR